MSAHLADGSPSVSLPRPVVPVALLVVLTLTGCQQPAEPAAQAAQPTPSVVMSPTVAPVPTLHAKRPVSRSRPGRSLDAHQLAAMTHARMSVSDGDIMRQLANTAERIAQRLAAGGANQPPAPATISPGTNRALGYALMIEFGWPASEWPALDALWQRESGWNHLAENPSSGAYGIPQSLPAAKMATVGADWKTNPETQIRWGLAYIGARYGTPSAAWAHSERFGWY